MLSKDFRPWPLPLGMAQSKAKGYNNLKLRDMNKCVGWLHATIRDVRQAHAAQELSTGEVNFVYEKADGIYNLKSGGAKEMADRIKDKMAIWMASPEKHSRFCTKCPIAELVVPWMNSESGRKIVLEAAEKNTKGEPAVIFIGPEEANPKHPNYKGAGFDWYAFFAQQSLEKKSPIDELAELISGKTTPTPAKKDEDSDDEEDEQIQKLILKLKEKKKAKEEAKKREREENDPIQQLLKRLKSNK